MKHTKRKPGILVQIKVREVKKVVIGYAQGIQALVMMDGVKLLWVGKINMLKDIQDMFPQQVPIIKVQIIEIIKPQKVRENTGGIHVMMQVVEKLK